MSAFIFCVKSIVRDYHISKDEWDPSMHVGDVSKLETGETNCHDRYAVGVIIDEIVGHVPQDISKNVYYIIRNHA